MRLKSLNSDFLWVSGIILIGLIFRAGYLLAPHMDSDQAVFALQGMHILKGEFPIFSWGYSYIGTLQSYIDAIFFYFFGVSRGIFNSVSLFFYLGYMIALYYLSEAVFKNKIWIYFVLLLGAIAPDYFMIHGAWGRHGYPETYCFGTIMLAMICQRAGKTVSLRYWLLLFFLAGVAWWTNFLILYYFLPVFVFWLFYIQKLSSLKKKAYYLIFSFIGFVVGSFPFWIHNLLNDFSSLKMFISSNQEKNFYEATVYLVTNIFPVLIGAYRYVSGQGIPVIKEIYLILFILIFIFFFIRLMFESLRVLKARALTPLGCVAFFVFSVFIIFFKSKYSVNPTLLTTRYLMPFYSIYPIIPVYFLFAVYSKYPKKYPAVIFLFLALSVNFYSIYLSNPLFNLKRIEKHKNEMMLKKNLFNDCERVGKNNFLLYAYWKSAINTFDSKEQYIFANLRSRYPKYIYEMMKEKTLNYLLVGKNPGFEKGLKTLGYDFNDSKLNSYRLYTDFKSNFKRNAKALPGNTFQIFYNGDVGISRSLKDNNYNTEFKIAAQISKPGVIDIMMHDSRELTGFCMVPENRFVIPRSFKVINLENNETILETDNYYPGFVAGSHPFLPPSAGFSEVFFNPVKTAKLRIEFKGSTRGGFFKLKELLFFESSFKSGCDEESLIKWVKKADFKKVFSSYAANSIFLDLIKKDFVSEVYNFKKIDFSKELLFVFDSRYLNYNLATLRNLKIDHEFIEGKTFSAIKTEKTDFIKAIWLGNSIYSKDYKKEARKLYKKALRVKRKEPNLAIEYLVKSIVNYKYYYDSYLLLKELYKEIKDYTSVEKLEKDIGKILNGGESVTGDFKKIKLLGSSLSKTDIYPGESLKIINNLYFIDPPKEHYASFIHFLVDNGEMLFQSDHYLKNERTKEDYLPGEMLVDENVILIPDDIKYNGRVEIWFGIHYPEKQKRFKVTSAHPVKDRSMKIGELNIKKYKKNQFVSK